MKRDEYVHMFGREDTFEKAIYRAGWELKMQELAERHGASVVAKHHAIERSRFLELALQLRNEVRI